MRSIHIQVRAVSKTRASMRSRAKAAHLTNAERAHHRTSISRTAPNDLYIRRPSEESFQFLTQSKDAIEARRKHFNGALSIFSPRAAKNLRRKNDRSRCRICVSLCRVAVLRPRKNRQLILTQIPPRLPRIFEKSPRPRPPPL